VKVRIIGLIALIEHVEACRTDRPVTLLTTYNSKPIYRPYWLYKILRATGRFAPSSVRTLDVSPTRRFAPWTHSRFPSHSIHFLLLLLSCVWLLLLKQMIMKIPLIQLIPKHYGAKSI